MRRTYLYAAALVALTALPASAQDDLLQSCQSLTIRAEDSNGQTATFTPPASLADQVNTLCDQVVTTLSGIQPAIGMGFSGANPVLGTAGTIGTRLGMIPRVSITARVNVATTEVADLFDGFDPSVDDANPSVDPVPTTRIPIGSLQGDIAIGVFNGLSLGPTLGGLGSIDLLGSVSYVPAFEDAGLEDPIIAYGGGARIGILRGGLVMPALSVSGMYRKMSEVEFGDLAADDPGEFSTDLTTYSFRIVASKGLALLDLAIGAGYDKYSSDSSLNFALDCTTSDCTTIDPNGLTLSAAQPITGETSTAAWNVFGNVGIDLFVLNLVAEVGYQKATDVVGFDDVGTGVTEEELGGGSLFGSVGLRFTI